MNIKDMFIDSVKYSLNGRLEFLFLGVLLWSLSFILYLVNEFPLSWVLIIPWLIFLFVEGGYLATIIEDTIWGSDVYPKFENFRELIWKGIKELFIFFIYSLIPVVVLIVLFFDIMLFNVDFPTLILLILFVLSLFFSIIVIQGAVIHYEYNHSKFSSAFEVRTIIRKLRNMGKGRFISSFLIVLLITLLIEPTIAEFSEELHPILSTIMKFTLLPFITIFAARFTGLIGRYHFKEN